MKEKWWTQENLTLTCGGGSITVPHVLTVSLNWDQTDHDWNTKLELEYDAWL